jgi:hypothetical protein
MFGKKRKKKAITLNSKSYDKVILADNVFTLRFNKDTFVPEGDEIRITLKHKLTEFR